MRWVRYSGAGNTFLVGDNRSHRFDEQTAASLCQHEGVDGLILLEDSTHADAKMRIFNSDGSEAEMCGNGIRCLIHYLGVKKSTYLIETLAGLQEGWLTEKGVAIRLAPPSQLRLNLPYDLHFVNTGVPHAVYFIDRVDTIAVNEIGRALRFSPLFAPAGANINFVALQEDGSIALRTYERGVERETQACGTGATAAALIAHKVHALPSPIRVGVRSGETLKVSFNDDWSEVVLEGPILVLKEETPIMAGA